MAGSTGGLRHWFGQIIDCQAFVVLAHFEYELLN